jgi:hypothetical protein
MRVLQQTNLDTKYPLLCLECVPGRVIPECEDLAKATKLSRKQGVEKTSRDDDEGEWRGIPIPQRDDSDDEYWLDKVSSAESESEQHEAEAGPSTLNLRKSDDDFNDASSNLTFQAQINPTSTAKKEKTQMSMNNLDDLAFLIGPCHDGSIKRKNDTVLWLPWLGTVYTVP